MQHADQAGDRAAHRDVRDRLQDVLSALLDEYSDRLSPGSIVRCFARCRRVVARSSVAPADVPHEVEVLARWCLESRVGRGTGIPSQGDPRRHSPDPDRTDGP
jgi:hypothetical protein